MKKIVILNNVGSKLFLAKGGGYTPNLSEARTWKTVNGAVKFIEAKLMQYNPKAVWIEIEN